MGAWGHGDWGTRGLRTKTYIGTWIGNGGERPNTINETTL